MNISILLLISQFFFWSYPIDWQMHQQTVVVRGAVVDETSGAPISGATVYALSAADVRKTTSDANGRFIFLTLLPGTYRLCASKYGYAVDCSSQGLGQEELFAGFEYGATVVLSQALGAQPLGPVPAAASGTR